MPDQPAAPMDPDESRSPARISRLAAEAFGTFLLVFGGAGAALIASTFPTAQNTVGIGYVGVALAFGLTVVGAGYAVGHVSGGHFNPAVTIGLTVAGKFPRIDVGPYIAAQLIGGIIASSALHRRWRARRELPPSPHGRVRLQRVRHPLPRRLQPPRGRCDRGHPHRRVRLRHPRRHRKNALDGFGPLAIGLTLTLIHLVAIPVDNTSVNPARSIATALYGGGTALGQVWVFILAPLAGAAIAGYTHKTLFTRTMPHTPEH